MAYISNKDRILATLRRGKALTARQLCDKLNMNDTNAVYTAISTLRREGHPITSHKDRKTQANRYAMGA